MFMLIQTKFLGPTTTKPARIKVKVRNSKSYTYNYNHNTGSYDNHFDFAKLAIQDYIQDRNLNLISLQTVNAIYDAGYYFVADIREIDPKILEV